MKNKILQIQVDYDTTEISFYFHGWWIENGKLKNGPYSSKRFRKGSKTRNYLERIERAIKSNR